MHFEVGVELFLACIGVSPKAGLAEAVSDAVELVDRDEVGVPVTTGISEPRSAEENAESRRTRIMRR